MAKSLGRPTMKGLVAEVIRMDEAPLIDRYLPKFQFREMHDCVLSAEVPHTIKVAAEYQPKSDRFFRAMIGVREGPMHLSDFLTGKGWEGSEPFGLDNFTLLEQREDVLVYGLIGQFWKRNYGLRPVVDGNDFTSFSGVEAAKLVLGFAASRQADGRTRLVTETRVFCPDRATRLKFLPYWLLIRPVSGLIRRRILASIKKQSEAVSASLAM